jgi:hypothetical protein
VEIVAPGTGVSVLTGDGLIDLVDVQLEGEARQKSWDVIRKLYTRLGE